MLSRLSSSSSDPWEDMASADPQPYDKDEPLRELRPPLCGYGLRTLLSSKKTQRSASRQTASYSRVKNSRTPSERDSLLVIEPTSRSQGLSRNRGRRLGLNRRGVHITEGKKARSPSPESTTSSDNGGLAPGNRRMLAELVRSATSARDGEGEETAPYYVLQFDPSKSSDSYSPRKITEDEEPAVDDKATSSEEPSKSSDSYSPTSIREDEKPAVDDKATSRSADHTACIVQRVPSRSSQTKVKRAAWSTSLPSVVEENTEDGIGQSTSSASTTSPQHSEIMRAMSSLVRKQQRSIEDMEAENKRFREELAEYRRMLSEAHSDRAKEEDKVGLLTAEKKTTESATLWLREEMKALKAEIARMKDEGRSGKALLHYGSSQNKTPSLFKSTGDEDPALVQFAEKKKAIYGNILEVDSLLKSKSEESFADSSIFTDDRRDDTTATSSGISSSDVERQDDDDHQRVSNGGHVFSTGSSVGLHNASLVSSRTDEQNEVDSSQSSAARSKEEVTLFKSRLQAIQKKREERKSRDGDFGSRSGRVSFD